VTTFTHFTDPYRISNDVGSPFTPPYRDGSGESYFQWNGALDGLDEADFSMLVRTIELVVQAGTFSRERLQRALRISPELAAKMTTSIEKLGVIAPGEPDTIRRVLINVLGLEVFLAKVLSGRHYLVEALATAS
jgi:hypothetical protein